MYPGIPKIIHQTWKTTVIPIEWKEFQSSWQRFHPDWQYILWTNEDNRRFIETHYPEFITTYDDYSYDIQRADAVRYFILHHFGGIYADLDLECLRPMDDAILDRPFVTAYEPEAHVVQLRESYMVGNAFMASIPESLCLNRIIETMKTRSPRIVSHKEVLSSTGPEMVTSALKGIGEHEIRILDSYVFYPFTHGSPEMEDLMLGKNCHRLKEASLQKGAYGIHYWQNTWVRNLAGHLINPDPHSVKGYIFYPGTDSPGFDIKNGGRDINALSAECTADARAVGFNTDGFIKFRLHPVPRWRTIDNEAGNQGLYVKNNGKCGVIYSCVLFCAESDAFLR
jgi:hypothetical protein